MPNTPRIRPFRIVVVHPDALIRSSLTAALPPMPRIEGVWAHPDLAHAAAWAKIALPCPPDGAEVAMVHLSGQADIWRAARCLTATRPRIRVVALSSMPTEVERDRAKNAGFHGYACGDVSVAEYVELAARVAGGEWVQPDRMMEMPLGAKDVAVALPVYEALAHGRRPEQVGFHERTGRRLRSRLCAALGATNDAHALAMLIALGLIRPPQRPEPPQQSADR